MAADDPKTKCPGEKEFLQKDGTCSVCGNYSIPTPDKTDCELPKCGEREFVRENGTCKTCPDYQVKCFILHCKDPGCQLDGKVTNKDGSCGEKCKPGQKLDGNKCLDIKCPGDRFFLKDDGSCGECKHYQKLSQDKKSCVPITCDAGVRIGEHACGEKCGDYLVLSDDKKSCVKAKACEDGKMLKKDGSCIACDADKTVGPDGRSCIKKGCDNKLHKLGADGKCVKCEDFKEPSDDLKTCVDPSHCSARDIITKDA